MNRPADQVVPRDQRRIGKWVLRFHHAGVVVSVIAVDEKPSAQAEFGPQIDASRKRQVGIEVGSGPKRTGSGRAAICETDEVIKLRIEIIGGNSPAVGGELLV